MVDIMSPTSRHEVDEIVDQINFAVNIFPKMDGYSPHQHVFRKKHGIPGNLELRDNRTRPIRGSYNPGGVVYFWKMRPKEKKASWHGSETVVGYHDGKSKL